MSPLTAQRSVQQVSALPFEKELGNAIKAESKVKPNKDFAKKQFVAALGGVLAGVPLTERAAVAADVMKEVSQVGLGEPDIVTVGWAALCVMFSTSIALVIWGRSGI